MGLCISKREKKESDQAYNQTDSSSSYQSTKSMIHKSNRGSKNKSPTFHDKDKGNDNHIDAFEMEHELMKHAWRTNFEGGIEELKKGRLSVLDVSSGTGYWIADMARQFPQSHFVGIQTSSKIKKPHFPHNAVFIRADILCGISYGNSSFDYVHMRCLNSTFTEDNWKFAIGEIARVIKPGGIVEIVVRDEEFVDCGPILKTLNDTYRACSETINVKTNISKDLKQMILDTRKFSVIDHQFCSVPIGRSSGKLGKMALDYFIQIIEPSHEILYSYLGKTKQEFEELLGSLNSEFDKYKNASFKSVRIICRNVECAKQEI